jgi:hypothetical protein
VFFSLARVISALPNSPRKRPSARLSREARIELRYPARPASPENSSRVPAHGPKPTGVNRSRPHLAPKISLCSPSVPARPRPPPPFLPLAAVLCRCLLGARRRRRLAIVRRLLLDAACRRIEAVRCRRRPDAGRRRWPDAARCLLGAGRRRLLWPLPATATRSAATRPAPLLELLRTCRSRLVSVCVDHAPAMVELRQASSSSGGRAPTGVELRPWLRLAPARSTSRDRIAFLFFV